MSEKMLRPLSMAVGWIESAHDATGRRGISGGYDLTSGWLPAYAETSGYSIYTLLRAGRLLHRPELAERAHQVGSWLLELQRSDGSFPGEMGTDGSSIVFDVGQILLGLIALYREDQHLTMLSAAERGAAWLCDEQDADGAWTRNAFLGFDNSYSTRVAWAFAEVWKETVNIRYRDCAERYLSWVLSHVRPDGWIERMAFQADEEAYTHTIAYTLRGLLRTADIIGGALGSRCIDAAMKAALKLSEIRTPLFPLLPGQIKEGFVPAAEYACLTGDAQMVTVWLDVAQRFDLPRLHHRCEQVLTRLRELQVWQPLEPAVVGALPGSWPLAGGYEALRFPNWATKFLADAYLSFGEDVHRGLEFTHDWC